MSKTQLTAVSARLDRLKKWRTATGKSLTLDPALIWPMTSMKSLASSPQELERELRSPDVRKWQRAEFGPSIRRALDHLP